jgi:hypothetical protein
MHMIWAGRLVGTFHGYKSGRVYALSDGTQWQQTDLTDEPEYRCDPTTRLLSNRAGSIYLDVEGTCAMVRVNQAGISPAATIRIF